MNPWLLEMIAAARRDEWLRAAAPRSDHRARSGGRPIRQATGAWLVRAGNRVAGYELSTSMAPRSPRPAI
jgi:hypothetical protein